MRCTALEQAMLLMEDEGLDLADVAERLCKASGHERLPKAPAARAQEGINSQGNIVDI